MATHLLQIDKQIESCQKVLAAWQNRADAEAKILTGLLLHKEAIQDKATELMSTMPDVSYDALLQKAESDLKEMLKAQSEITKFEARAKKLREVGNTDNGGFLDGIRDKFSSSGEHKQGSIEKAMAAFGEGIAKQMQAQVEAQEQAHVEAQAHPINKD